MGGDIKIENLWKKYGDNWVLRNVNLTVDKGTFFALMGPNGSGKTTLAKIMTTIEEPTKGKVYVGGYDVLTEGKKVREQLSYLPEEHFLSDYLTGIENITFFGKLMGLGKNEIKIRARKLLEDFKLEEHAKKKVGKYSKGMKRKLAVIISLITDKPILILDEPTTGLDPIARRELLELLLKTAKDSTLVMNTHIGQDAEVARKVAFLSLGELIAMGSPDKLKRRFVRGRVLHVKLPVKSSKLEDYLKGVSISGALTETDEGYRIIVDGVGARRDITRVSEKFGLKVRIGEEEPSLEDAFSVAVMKHEARGS